MNPMQFLKEYHLTEVLPPIKIYVELLKIAMVKLHITEQEARRRYWNASVKQWCEVLQITIN